MRIIKGVFGAASVTGLIFGLTGCSGSSSSSGDVLNVSGVLNLGVGSQSIQKVQTLAVSEDSVSAMSVNLASYKVSCATTTAPVQTATATVNSDGSFTVTIPGATGQPLACFLVDSQGNKAADFLIADSSKKDLNGNAQTSSTTSFKKDANLGTINFDPNAGEVTVPATNIASVVAPVTVTASQVFDPTGAWTIGAVDFTLPSGAKGPCSGGGNQCHGPTSGQDIYLKLWKGVQTSDNSGVYGLQVWQGQNQFTTCGSKIGLTTAMKTALGVDFSSYGNTVDDVFSIASSVPAFADPISNTTSDVTLTDGWKMSTAKTLYQMTPDCGPKDITIGGTTYSNAWVCGPDSTNNSYQAQLGGGCSDSSGNPVNVNDWSGIQCNAPTTDSNGIQSSSCTGTASVNNQSISVSCTNKWAIVNGSGSVIANGVFDWSKLAQIPAGTSCSDNTKFTGASEALKIAQLQCYANYYWQSGMEQVNACLPRVDMDWSAVLAANFAKVDQVRPQGLIFFEKYQPFSDGTGGSMMTRQEHYDGVQVGSSWVNCHVVEVGGLNIKKVSDTKLLATYQSSTITTSILKPACLAKFAGARETYMFYLNK
ncbi:MAG: hypothetical protein ACM3MG_12150 [Bacillota bacterium]